MPVRSSDRYSHDCQSDNESHFLQDGVADVQCVVVLDASVPERFHPDGCSPNFLYVLLGRLDTIRYEMV